MKPCRHKKRPIALFVANALKPSEADAVREHLRTCAGCAHYFDELTAIQREHKTLISTAGEIRATDFFHQQLVQRIAQVDSRPADSHPLPGIFKWLNWQVGFATVLLAVLALWLSTRREPVTPPRLVVHISAPSRPARQTPSLGVYQNVIAKSPDQLDTFLAAQSAASPVSHPEVNTFHAFQRDMPE